MIIELRTLYTCTVAHALHNTNILLKKSRNICNKNKEIMELIIVPETNWILQIELTILWIVYNYNSLS